MEENSKQIQQVILGCLPKLRRFAYSLTGSPTDADDLLQATVERALTRSQQLEDKTEPIRWLIVICRNIWIDEVRRRKARPEYAVEEANALVGESGETIEARLEMTHVSTLIAQLDEDQRSVLMLVAVEGYSYKEAAEVLGWPIGTVMSRIARARGRLADELEKAGGSA